MLSTILLFVFVFIFGGVIGALVVTLYLDKSMTGLMDSCNDLVAALWGVIRQTYHTLLALRDSGTRNLDETIEYLGKCLECHEEDSK